MRQNDKTAQISKNPLFTVNFHDFIEKEQNATTHLELASEFGIALKDVKKLKKRLGRS